MIKTVINILKDLLQHDFFRRLLIVCLLPNLLVLGFSSNDLDNPENPLWRFLLNPYWQIEKFIFYAFVVMCVFDILIACLESISAAIEEKQKREQEEKREYERQLQNEIDYNNYLKRQTIRKKYEDQNPKPAAAKEFKSIVTEPKPLSPEEAKQKALRELTGRGA